MFYSIVRVGLFLAFMLATSLHAAPLAAPETCTGYSEPRIFVESQAWWQITPGSGGDEDFGRISTALCFPFKQHVRGKVPLDVLLTLHNSPGTLTGLAVQISPDGSGQYVAAKTKLNYTCSGTCSWLIHLEADTTGLSVDGWHEWRIRPSLSFTGQSDKLVGSTSWQAYTANGKPVRNYRPADFMQMKAWYTTMDYAQSRITSGYTYGVPVKGLWTIQVACDASSKPVTGCTVAIDPGPQLSSFGTMLVQRSGGYSGGVTIDTTRLANGPHTLAIKTDVISVKQGSTMTGVALLPFTVAN